MYISISVAINWITLFVFDSITRIMFYGKKEEEALDPNINHESKSTPSLR